MPTHIAVNGRYLHRRITGVERYAQEISSRLQPSPRFITPKRPLRQISGHLWEQFILPGLLKKNETLWSPANTSAWSVHRQAVTIHDASVFDHPEWFQPSFAAWTRLSWRILSRQAKAIITVSDFSRERLKFHLRIASEKIHVIPNGVGKPFEPQPEKAIEEVKTKFNLSKPYFLFVGTHEPRKNLETLGRAWEFFQPSSHLLVIAGTRGDVFAPIEERPVAGMVYTGYLSDNDLPAMYSGATAVVVPSLYEGFGLTALEAMACGAPVIASNTTSFPETLGDAALLVNPKDAKEIANAMRQITDDNLLRNTLRERGFRQASLYTWDEAAQKTQSLLESL